MKSFEELVALLEDLTFDSSADPSQDILRQEPGLSLADAERLQIALMRRRAQHGDQIIGYKASRVPNPVVQYQQHRQDGQQKGTAWSKMSRLSLGTLRSSLLVSDGETVAVGYGPMVVEPELAVLLERDLAGPNVTAAAVQHAAEGFLASCEFTPVPRGWDEDAWSVQHIAATNKTSGHILLSTTLVSPYGIDLRLEGAALRVNGELRGVGLGVCQMGDPLQVVAELANRLADYEETMRAGMIVMTGTLLGPSVGLVGPGDVDVCADFTRLGSLRARFAYEA